MAHAVKRIMFCTADAKKHLFVFVAKNPESGPEGVYSHVFLTAKKEQVRRTILHKMMSSSGLCMVRVVVISTLAQNS